MKCSSVSLVLDFDHRANTSNFRPDNTRLEKSGHHKFMAAWKCSACLQDRSRGLVIRCNIYVDFFSLLDRQSCFTKPLGDYAGQVK